MASVIVSAFDGGLVNATLGPYTLRGLISAGGLAEVYKATHADDPRRTYAVKVLRRERMGERRHIEAFENEYALLEKLDHRGIPKAKRYGEVKTRPAFVMEYVPGIPLHLLIEKQDTFEVERAFLSLIEIVAYLHASRIVHNDLKLENMILWSSNEVSLVDFGNARVLKNGLFARFFPAKKESLFGTPSYFAPELLNGESPSYASDIYAIGVCCFMLLSGEAPFTHDRTSQRLRAAVHEQAPSIADRAPGLNPNFVKLIDSCLNKNPRLRPIDANQLMQALSMVRRSKEGTGMYRAIRQEDESKPNG
jgi:eukaryotic-like serine/threonine-protein kinase